MSHELDLFSEMDAAADMLRENNPQLRETLSDELQLEFRQLQKKRMPQLSKGQFLDLLHEWRDHYLARLEVELPATRKRMAENDRKLAELAAELRGRRGNSTNTNRFVCECGEVIADPLDFEQMRIHQPHFIAASLPQVHAALERRRECASHGRNGRRPAVRPKGHRRSPAFSGVDPSFAPVSLRPSPDLPGLSPMTFEQLAAIARDWQSRLTPAQVRAGVESLRRQVYVSDLHDDAIPLDDAPLKAAIEAAGGVKSWWGHASHAANAP